MSNGYQSVIEALEQWAPPAYAEEWDNVGLQVGDPSQEIKKILVALNPSLAAAKKAAQLGADLLVTHHPLLFQPLRSVTLEKASGQVVAWLLRHEINLYCAHTNLDIAQGGVNDVLAERLNLHAVQPLADCFRESCYKLVVYVPEGHEAAVRQAVCNAGAGWIGNYSHCTFQTQGQGTFLPLEGSQPYLGSQGTLEYASEYRLETIVPAGVLPKVLLAMEQAHPYEEVAYDLFRLENEGMEQGIGRIGRLPEPMSFLDFMSMLSAALEQPHLTYGGVLPVQVQKVAVCGGSGASYLAAAKNAGADVYVTGDVKYHDGQRAEELGITIIDAGHFATERWIVEALAVFLRKQGAEVVTFVEEEDYLKHYRGSWK